MTFSDFKTLENALKELQVDGHLEEFVQPVPHKTAALVRDRIELMRRVGYGHSESAVAEGLIFPVLLESWEPYVHFLKVWSRLGFGTDDLYGKPDYVVTRVPIMGQLRFAPPYVVIVEAKQEKFDEGWGQCLAAMVAAQRLNQPGKYVIYGAVTTGVLWEFGRLHGSIFTQHPRTFSIQNLDELCGAIRFVFEQVKGYDVPPPIGVREVA